MRQSTFEFCCGVDEIGSFFPSQQGDATRISASGTGLYVATFIDRESNKQAYEYLCRKKQLLFQTKPYLNSSSGNRLFLAVFGPKAKTSRQPVTTTQRPGERLPQLS